MAGVVVFHSEVTTNLLLHPTPSSTSPTSLPHLPPPPPPPPPPPHATPTRTPSNPPSSPQVSANVVAKKRTTAVFQVLAAKKIECAPSLPAQPFAAQQLCPFDNTARTPFLVLSIDLLHNARAFTAAPAGTRLLMSRSMKRGKSKRARYSRENIFPGKDGGKGGEE